jgi:hypothetical protein
LLRSIFGPKWDEEMGGWKNLRDEELHNLYSFPSTISIIKSRRIRWAGRVTRREMNEYRILVGKPKGKRPLGRPRPQWRDNDKMKFREMEWGVWTGLIRLRIGTSGWLCEHSY